jgi:hypothetical protein
MTEEEDATINLANLHTASTATTYPSLNYPLHATSLPRHTSIYTHPPAPALTHRIKKKKKQKKQKAKATRGDKTL